MNDKELRLQCVKLANGDVGLAQAIYEFVIGDQVATADADSGGSGRPPGP